MSIRNPNPLVLNDFKYFFRGSKKKNKSGNDSYLVQFLVDGKRKTVSLCSKYRQAEEGEFYVIDHWRGPIQNLRTHFRRIIFRAGLPEWPRLFHNMRGSRSNELFSSYPAHVAAYWMGQSAKVAMEHYLHPTDDQYNQAINTPSQPLQSDTPTKKSKTTKEVSNPSDADSPNKQ